MGGSSVPVLLTQVSPDAPRKLEVLWPALADNLSALLGRVCTDISMLAHCVAYI